ncbi:hypothetical protein PSFL_24360 [Pseudomonas sp. DD1]|uniref:hypothetical protein n=1 Tax=Pseudomonas sp. DD1 TaxID=879558 RepID=UPI0037CC9DF3
MAKNDTILVDSLLQQTQKETPGDIGDIFERFALDQILKSFDLSTEEMDFGWTDGSLDGGIDGFYILINGRLLTDATDFSWPRTGAEIKVFIITCKHHETFQQAPLDSLLATAQDIFDLSLSNSELSGKYSAKIKQCRDLFVSAFKQLSLYRPTISFEIVYASRGNTELLGASIKARAKQLTTLFNSYFSASTSVFHALGASELVERYRQVRSFPFTPTPSLVGGLSVVSQVIAGGACRMVHRSVGIRWIAFLRKRSSCQIRNFRPLGTFASLPPSTDCCMGYNWGGLKFDNGSQMRINIENRPLHQCRQNCSKRFVLPLHKLQQPRGGAES